MTKAVRVPPKMMSINEFNGNPLRPMSPKSHTYAEQNVQILQKERKKYGQNREFALGGQPKSSLCVSLCPVSGNSHRPSIRGDRWVIPARGFLKCF